MRGQLRTRFLILLTQKEQREGRRIRNTEIVEATGVSLPTVHRWLRDEVTRFEKPVLESFCAYFDCDVGDLLFIDPDESAAS